MGCVKDFLDANEDSLSRAIITIISVLTPGSTIVFLFYNDLIYSLDFVKLIIIILLFSSPYLLLSLFCLPETVSKNEVTITWLLTNLIYFMISFAIFFIYLTSPEAIFDVSSFLSVTLFLYCLAGFVSVVKPKLDKM